MGRWRRPAEQMIADIEQAMKVGGWVLYTTHGVGAGHQRLRKDEGEHQKLLEYLTAHREKVWTAPVIEVARYVRKSREC